MHRNHYGTSERDYSLSVIMTADPKMQAKLRARFLDFLKDAEAMVKDAPSEELYQMNFDLFCWSKS